MKAPKGHVIWLNICDKYIITTKGMDRSKYYIYDIANGKTTKLGENVNPVVLEKKYASRTCVRSDSVADLC